MIRKLRPFLGAAFLAQVTSFAGAMEPGAYRVTYRLEVPHVERFALDTAVMVCATADALLPRVLSGNNPLAHCPASNVRRDGAHLTFDIVCPGRRNDGASASAAYVFSKAGGEGRIKMVMGGKNMTFVEVQSWRRIGGCQRLAGQ